MPGSTTSNLAPYCSPHFMQADILTYSSDDMRDPLQYEQLRFML
ncbi:MAG: hypothetical protein Q7R80_01485 [bacterium]|nr:hypothetical protein [bacterium]